ARNVSLGPSRHMKLKHRSTARDRSTWQVTAVVQHALKLGRIVLSATTPDTGQPTREVSTAAASSAAGTSTGSPPRRLGLALAVIATAQLMVVLDATIVNVALPHIQNALHFSGANLEWVVNAYALAFRGLLLLGGRSGDLLW